MERLQMVCSFLRIVYWKPLLHLNSSSVQTHDLILNSSQINNELGENTQFDSIIHSEV